MSSKKPIIKGYTINHKLTQTPRSRLYVVEREGREYIAKVTTDLRSAECEAKALQEVGKKSGIPQLHEVKSRGGNKILILEYLPGRAIQSFPEIAELPRYIRQLASLAHTLAGVHEAGYVHLDVKPDNIIVDGEAVTLIDFGEARKIKEPFFPAASSCKQTYWPPETREPLVLAQPTIDIYALGILLKRGLGNATRGVQDVDIIQNILSEENFGLVAKLTAADPQERITKSSEAAERLEALVEPVQILSRYLRE